MITTIRTRNAVTGQISYQNVRPLAEVTECTIIEILGERIYAEQVEHFAHGETKITDWHGQVSRWGSDNIVTLMGSWNPPTAE